MENNTDYELYELMRKEYGNLIETVEKQDIQIEQYKEKINTYKNRKVILLANDLAKIMRKFAISNLKKYIKYNYNKFRYKIKSLVDKNTGVSIIITTDEKNDNLGKCVDSAINQTIKKDKVQILICVYGDNEDYYKDLENRYSDYAIKVLYTEKTNIGAARNLGVSNASKDYFTFLDGGDFISKGFIKELYSYVAKDINVIFGKINEYKEGEINSNTSINKSLRQSGRGIKHCGFKPENVLNGVTAKLFNRSFYNKNFKSFDETVSTKEDVVFWSYNIDNLKGNYFIADLNTSEAYNLNIPNDDIYDPNDEEELKINVLDRITVIEKLSDLIFEENINVKSKKFIIEAINSQEDLIYEYYEGLPEVKQEQVRNSIYSSSSPFISKGKYSNVHGIAFCHNFAPATDPSAYVATRRLAQINDLENTIVNWDVVSLNMVADFPNDWDYNLFYAKYQYTKLASLKGLIRPGGKAEYYWAKNALNHELYKKVDCIYSRSMSAPSHLAAYNYKKLYPEVKWYAEFSDPLVKNIDNKHRFISKSYKGEEEVLNNYWEKIENMVYEKADVIIYTNNNQKEFMLDYHKSDNLEDIEKRSIVINHPVMENRYTNIINTKYNLDSSKINIGYFGSFYANRNYTSLLKLLDRKDVILHIFTLKYDEIHEEFTENEIDVSQIRLNPLVSNLEMLNIASKMDYLYLHDAEFPGPIIPYRPSKLADYLTSGTRIIARIVEGSDMSKDKSEQLIKVTSITKPFLDQLTKSD